MLAGGTGVDKVYSRTFQGDIQGDISIENPRRTARNLEEVIHMLHSRRLQNFHSRGIEIRSQGDSLNKQHLIVNLKSPSAPDHLL
jgi:hypothetical protein